jgi:two-component system OmpR family sensor kinase
MAVVLLGLGTFLYIRLGDDLLASVDMGLRSRAQVLVDAVEGAGGQDVISAEGLLIDPDEAFAQVLDSSGGIVDASEAVTETPLLSPAEVSAVSEPDFVTKQFAGFDDPVRLMAVSVHGPGERSIVVVGATLGDMSDALASLLAVMATLGPAALLVTATAGWLLAKAALRPVEDMQREAAAISASEPARRLPVPGTGDELARLASTLNSMLDRLQEALERERRFVDDASHELRTPLTTLRGEIELALARSRTAPELEASMRSIKEDVDRLGRLAEDLLVLARARGGRIPLRRAPTPLNELVTRSIRSVAGRARDRAIEVSSDATSERVNVDPERVEQALRNLLENAVRHTPAGGTVHVAASSSDGEAQFLVEDSGSGFPLELIGTAFDAFARGIGEGDGDGGAGLGLTIVRAVAEAHGGSATAENTPTGARVTLTLRT